MNDTYGHLYGDEVLREIGEILRSELRGHDIFARYGSEEFVILLLEKDVNAAFLVAEKLRGVIAKKDVVKDEIKSNVTVSFGVAQFDPSTMTGRNQLVKHLIKHSTKLKGQEEISLLFLSLENSSKCLK